MRLSVKMLENVINVNNFNHVSQVYLQAGQINEFYFQLVDLNKDPSLRYLSQATSMSVSVHFDSIDDAQAFDVSATKPFTDDKSIWKIALTAAQVPKSGAIKVTVTEDSVVKSFIVKAAISVELTEIGSC